MLARSTNLMIEIKCSHCNRLFKRQNKEHKRNTVKGRVPYCSLKCMGHDSKPVKNKLLYQGYTSPLPTPRDPDAPFRYYLKLIRKRDREKGNELSNKLTVAHLKDIWNQQGKKCPLTGVDLVLPRYTSGFEEHVHYIYKASLDRIDSGIWYEPGNVRFVSVAVNLAKASMSDNEFIKLCELVVKRCNI